MEGTSRFWVHHVGIELSLLFKHLKPGMISFQTYRDQCTVPDLSLTACAAAYAWHCQSSETARLSTLAAGLSSSACRDAPSHSLNTIVSCAARHACCHVQQQQLQQPLQQAAACLWMAQVSFWVADCSPLRPPASATEAGRHVYSASEPSQPFATTAARTVWVCTLLAGWFVSEAWCWAGLTLPVGVQPMIALRLMPA